ncbi:acetyltransferase [Vibrio parahaemolyticus]|nr:acetyltransferase [Vibrio parahaemolyticus]EGR1384173.1 acetyltransferase [Vibrio parahaemolyticus]
MNITKRLRRIHNAWHFQFDSTLVFTAQWFRFSSLRCSPLNAALCSPRKKWNIV